MIRFCDWTTTQWAARQRAHRKSLAAALTAAVFLQPTFAQAATIDWNVTPGPANYDSALDPDAGATPNWIDLTQTNTTIIPVSPPLNTPVGIPATTDDAVVRNGGIAEITSAIVNNRLDVGFPRTLFTDDGVTITQTEAGGNGTVNMSGAGASLTGSGPNGLQLRLGGVGLSSAGSPVYTGIFNQSGGTVTMGVAGNPGSIITVGSQGSTPTPTSQYNLSGGTISVAVGAANNTGINVRNGTFTMTGGSIVSTGTPGQRFMTISSTSGAMGTENVASATFSGGIVNVSGGIRMAPNNHTKAYMTINGTADVKIIGNDIQLGASGPNAYAQVDMSAGLLRLGDASEGSGTNRRLIVGDNSNGGTGVFNLSGGTVNLYSSFVVANNALTKGTFTQTGGTFSVRDIEMNRSSGAWNPLVENATILIDGPTAVFNQQANSQGSGFTTIGQFGNGRFEIRQGQANLVAIRTSQNPGSRATLNVAGGILRVQDGLTRADVTAATIPTIGLTGGELELTPAGAIISWQAGMELLGTDFDPKPLALLQTNIGNSTRPGNFSLNSGSIWDLDIANGTLTGADWVDVNLGSAALNGGLLNIHHIGGYTPAAGHTVRILRNLINGVTLGGVAISDPNWQAIVANSGTEIHLRYIPEPTSALLTGLGLLMGLAASRRCRSRLS